MRRQLLALALLLLPASASAQSHLSAALRFVPATSEVVYFTDWQAIRDDVSTVWPVEPTVGDDDYIRALASRHRPTTATATQNGPVWLLAQEWGWSLLDVIWEVETDERVAVVAFTEGFVPHLLLELLAERGYQTSTHEGQDVHSHAMDLSLVWLRPPLGAFQNVAYLADEGVLLLAYTRDALVGALDALGGRAPRWLGDEATVDLGVALTGASSAAFVSYQRACTDHAPNEGVLDYQLVAAGYQRSGEEILGKLVFAYPDEASALADLAARARLAAEGSDNRTGRPLSVHFELLDAQAAGTVSTLSARLGTPGALFDLLYFFGADVLACRA